MPVTWNSDGSLYVYGVFSASDYNTIVNRYNTILGLSLSTRPTGHVLTAADLEAIRDAIYTKSGDYNIPTLPGPFSKGQLWPKMTWPATSYKYREWTYTSNGDFYVPAGVYGINVISMVGGGGGGGAGTNYRYGGAGGSGGSGGWYQNYHINVNPGDHVQIYVGGGGMGFKLDGSYPANTGDGSVICGQSGGNTFITINGNTVLTATGGGGGYVARDFSPVGDDDATRRGNGGYAGGPNGVGGGQGQQGTSSKSGHNTFAGPNGANSPWGTGGSGGIATSNNGDPNINGQPASGYGAGGGGGGSCGRTGYFYRWYGGNGSPGRVVIGIPG